MEFFYTAYTKQIADKKYFFIKRYMTFPEIKNAANILDGYGMHFDFHKACNIAGIRNADIKEWLWLQLEPQQIKEARIIPLRTQNHSSERKFAFQHLLWRFPLSRLKFKF